MTSFIVRHRQERTRYVYSPTVPAEMARESAMRHLVRTFFRGSPSKAILTLLDSPSTRLSPNKLNELAAWVEAAKGETRSCALEPASTA